MYYDLVMSQNRNTRHENNEEKMLNFVVQVFFFLFLIKTLLFIYILLSYFLFFLITFEILAKHITPIISFM